MEKNINDMLLAIDSNNVCGKAIDDDSELFSLFTYLESVLEGKPEAQVGDSIIPEVKPDWKKVEEQSEALFYKTKDVRVAVYWAHSQLALYGFKGLNDGMCLIEGLIISFWDDVYPKLDDEDGVFSPSYRLNALNHLSSTTICDMSQMVGLTVSKVLGEFNYRDYLIAKGDLIPLVDVDAVVMPHIVSGFMETDVSYLLQLQSSLDQIIIKTNNILQFIDEKLVSHNDLDIDDFLQLIHKIKDLLDEQLQKRSLVNESDPLPINKEYIAISEGLSPTEVVPNTIAPTIEPINNLSIVNSRDDVIKCLDSICEYYHTNEPSSPIPLMLNRAKRIVSMDFLSLINDITPESLDQVKKMAGLNAEN